MMAIRDLRFYPDPILRQHCRKVEVFDQELQDFLDDLAESMYAHRGVGLAAPQVGDTRRAAVVDVGQQEDAPVLVELVNPQVVESSEELSEYEEGCLSFPGEAELVTRPARVTVRALDRKGNPFEIKAEGLLATALQHEIDHLDGIVFIDHISRLKRDLVERRMKKKSQAAAS
jgi:peptide deformylase